MKQVAFIEFGVEFVSAPIAESLAVELLQRLQEQYGIVAAYIREARSPFTKESMGGQG